MRLALNYAFDFEEMNKQLFFGQYQRINSYFEGTELASTGLPEGKELEILKTVGDKVPVAYDAAYSGRILTFGQRFGAPLILGAVGLMFSVIAQEWPFGPLSRHILWSAGTLEGYAGLQCFVCAGLR